MPDYRRTREEETQLYPQLVQFPSDPYISPNSLGGPGMGGAGNESGMGLAPQAALGGVDQRLASIQQLGDQRRGLEDQLASMQGQPSTRLMTTGELWQGLKDAGSSGLDLLGRGAKAILPTQEGWNEGAMRLQNANAIVNGGTPLWMMQQQHQAQMGQNDQLMALKRQQLSQQLQDYQLKQQQHMEDQALKVWQDPHMPLAMKKKMSQQMAMQGNALAGNLARLGDETLVAEMETLMPFLPKGKAEELMGMMSKPNADLDHLEQWVNFARDKKKVAGQQRMEHERFAELLGQYNDGKLDPTGADYDEFKQGVLKREKANQENAEMRLKLEQMGLTKKKTEQEYQMNQLMPQVSPEIPMPGGKTGKYVVDPQTMQRQLIQGEKPPTAKVDIKLGDSLTKPVGEIVQGTRDKALGALNTLDAASRLDKALEAGNVNIGPGATAFQWIDRVGQMMKVGGKTQAERITNTRNLIKGLAEFGLGARDLLKGSGAISDFEQRLLEKAAGGEIDSFTKDELQDFLRVVDRGARMQYDLHQQQLGNMKADKEDIQRLVPYYQVPKLPPPLPDKKVTGQATTPSTSTGPFSDPDKEKRYQEWKRKQGR